MNAAAANSEPAASALAVSAANNDRDAATAALRTAPDAMRAGQEAGDHGLGARNDGAAAMAASGG